MSSRFLNYILAPSDIIATYLDVSDPGSAPIFVSERVFVEGENTDISSSIDAVTANIKKNLKKNGLEFPSKSDVSIVVSSSPLIEAGVFGIAREWSVKAAKIASSSMMLDTKWAATLKEIGLKDFNFKSKVLVVSGGYDGSDTKKIDSLVRAVSQTEWFKQEKPYIIFRGSSNAADNAKLYFSPYTGFTAVKNVLSGNPADCIENFDSVFEALYLSECKLPDKIKKKKMHVFPKIISKISELFCRGSVSNLGTYFVNSKFSIFTHCEKRSGKFFNKRFSFPEDSMNIDSSRFSEAYKILFKNENHDVSDPGSLECSVFPIRKKETTLFYRPQKILGIVLDNNITPEKFLDLISDPDILRGKIEFIIDGSGAVISIALMLIGENYDERGDISEIVEQMPVLKGWLLVPDGKFDKDEPAVNFYSSGNTKIELIPLLWGKRYSFEIEPSSSVEISTLGGTFFKNVNEKKIVLNTYKSSKTVVIDLRKERS